MRSRLRNRWLRPGLYFLAAQAAVVGAWAAAWPRSFFTDFPSVGGAWVSAFPPYNEHLVRDVGGLYIGFAILFLWAASNLEAVLVRAALVAWVPFAVLHLWFHITHLEGLSAGEQALQVLALVAVTLVPLLLLAAQRKRRTSSFRRH